MVSSLLSITLPFFYPLSSTHLSTAPPLSGFLLMPPFIPSSSLHVRTAGIFPPLPASPFLLFSPHFHPVSRATSSTRLRVCVRTCMCVCVCVPTTQKEPQKKDLELQKSGIMQMNPASNNGLQQDLSQLIEAVWNEL